MGELRTRREAFTLVLAKIGNFSLFWINKFKTEMQILTWHFWIWWGGCSVQYTNGFEWFCRIRPKQTEINAVIVTLLWPIVQTNGSSPEPVAILGLNGFNLLVIFTGNECCPHLFIFSICVTCRIMAIQQAISQS